MPKRSCCGPMMYIFQLPILSWPGFTAGYKSGSDPERSRKQKQEPDSDYPFPDPQHCFYSYMYWDLKHVEHFKFSITLLIRLELRFTQRLY